MSTDNEIRSQAESGLVSLKQNDVRGFITNLVTIFTSTNFDIKHRVLSIIFAWQLFPENIQDIPEDSPHPFDVYSNELVQKVLSSSFEIMVHGDFQLRNYAATLFGRVASLHVHRDLNAKIVAKLAECLVQARTIEEVVPISNALQKVCNEFEPDDDELEILLTSLFNILGNVKEPRVVSETLKILSTVTTAMSTVLENRETLGNILDILLQLAATDGVQEAAFKVWSELYKISDDIIALVAPQLIEIAIQVLADANKSEGDIIQAAKLVKQIAKLELKTENEDFNPIESNAQHIVISLVRVCCAVLSPDCDDGSSWEPHLAASRALKHVLRILSDENLQSFAPLITNLGSSQEFGERYGSLVLLSYAILSSENPVTWLAFVDSLFAFCNDIAPRVCFQAIKCLKNLIMTLCDSNNINESIPKIAEHAFSVIKLINVDTPIAHQAAKLLGEISRTPGFIHTLEILQNLLECGTKLHILSYFDVISKIIDLGTDENAVFQFYPVLLQVSQIAVSNQSSIWALHELGENIQAYLIKFQNKLNELIPNTIQMLLQGAHAPSPFATDALIPLGMSAQIFPQIFPPYLSSTLEVIHAALNEVHNSQTIYDASMALSFIYMSGIQDPIISQMTPTFIEQIIKAISNMDLLLSLEARRSCVGCIGDIVKYHPNLFLPVADNFIVYLRTFSILDALNAEYITDPKETQLMLHALGVCLLNIMKIVGQKLIDYLDIATNIICFVVNIFSEEGEVIERLMVSTIDLIHFISQVDKNIVLTLISEREEIGMFIVNASSMSIPLSQETLDILGYTE